MSPPMKYGVSMKKLKNFFRSFDSAHCVRFTQDDMFLYWCHPERRPKAGVEGSILSCITAHRLI